VGARERLGGGLAASRGQPTALINTRTWLWQATLSGAGLRKVRSV